MGCSNVKELPIKAVDVAMLGPTKLGADLRYRFEDRLGIGR